MPISTVSEFEAVTYQAIIKIDKVLYERGEVPALKEARRELEGIKKVARDAETLKTKRETLQKVAEIVRVEISRDDELLNDMWDLLDYIDYGL